MTDPLFTQDDVRMLGRILPACEAELSIEYEQYLISLRSRIQSWLDQQKTPTVTLGLPMENGATLQIDQRDGKIYHHGTDIEYGHGFASPHRFNSYTD